MAMSKGYVAIGHGWTPQGKLDPGAVVPGSSNPVISEHEMAMRVVGIIEGVLRPNGVTNVHYESNGGPSHDPDYRGSAATVNAGSYQWAIEVHFDYFAAPRGGFGLFVSDKGRSWSSHIGHWYDVYKLVRRPNSQRHDLYFLNATHCPAIIWECDRVGRDVYSNPDLINQYGTCIGMGTLEWLKEAGMA